MKHEYDAWHEFTFTGLGEDLLVTNVEFFFTSHVELDIYYVGWLVFEKEKRKPEKKREKINQWGPNFFQSRIGQWKIGFCFNDKKTLQKKKLKW